MAIKKIVDVNGSGVIAEYWRVHFFAVDWDKKEGRISLLGYSNKEAREAGKDHIPGADISLHLYPHDVYDFSEMPAISGNTSKEVDLARLYPFLRAQRVKNPKYQLIDGEEMFSPGVFAGKDSGDA